MVFPYDLLQISKSPPPRLALRNLWMKPKLLPNKLSPYCLQKQLKSAVQINPVLRYISVIYWCEPGKV